MGKTKEGRISTEQKEVLVSFMKDHPKFLQGKFAKLEGNKKYLALWKILTTQLNSVKGPQKNTKKWQRVWTDLKHKIKFKVNHIKNARQASGGDFVANHIVLSEFEIKVMELMNSLNDSNVSNIDPGSSQTNIAPVLAPTPEVAETKLESPSLSPIPVSLSELSETESEAEEEIEYIYRGAKRRRISEEESSTTSEAEEASAKNAKSNSSREQLNQFMELNKELNNNLVRIEKNMKEGTQQLKTMNSFLERIAISLENMNKKFN